GIAGRLQALSPQSVLRRGYSITRKIPSGEIIKSADKTGVGERVRVTLYKGAIDCEVKKREE
ncbi:MAG: exodeoxyribonuclease VII large subunit, partial [Elusimicrobia bacterium]|nr:exodeoxyribonuclease VII large subunit [Elusimicrobiota bacterium]